MLDPKSFYELLEERTNFSRGIIRVLVQRLRARSENLVQLQKSRG